ncbi:MAG: fibronectin type III domain-containing protein [Candidatus Zixiibacteriota bacterium]
MDGTASVYELRYSYDSITVGTWTEASLVENISVPRSAGAEEFFTVNGLFPETTYYFAIRAFDEVGNRSRPSNVARTVTNPLDIQVEEFPLVEGATWTFSVHYKHPITQYEFDTTIILATSNVLLVDGRPVQAIWRWDDPPGNQSGTRTSVYLGDTLLFLPVFDDPFILRNLVFPLVVGSHWKVATEPGKRDSAFVAAREWLESERTGRIPVLRIEGELRIAGCISNSTWWVAPNVGLVRVKNRGRLHGCDRDYTWELIDYTIPGQ